MRDTFTIDIDLEPVPDWEVESELVKMLLESLLKGEFDVPSEEDIALEVTFRVSKKEFALDDYLLPVKVALQDTVYLDARSLVAVGAQVIPVKDKADVGYSIDISEVKLASEMESEEPQGIVGPEFSKLFSHEVKDEE